MARVSLFIIVEAYSMSVLSTLCLSGRFSWCQSMLVAIEQPQAGQQPSQTDDQLRAQAVLYAA
eukprot:37849-Eustigmatos_ZCMA.PRE.1